MRLEWGPLKVSLLLPIVLMGVVTISLVLATAQRYRELSLDHRRQSLAELAHLKAQDGLARTESYLRQLGDDILKEPEFRDAYTRMDTAWMSQRLNEEFHRYFQTSGVIQLEKIYVLNLGYQLVAESTEPSSARVNVNAKEASLCAEVIERASKRSGAEHLKALSDLCAYRGHALYATIMPIGRLRPSGFLMVVADPANNLVVDVGQELGMPIRINRPGGGTVLASADWPTDSAMRDMLVAHYTLRTAQGHPVLVLDLLSDMLQLEQDLGRTRSLMLSVAGVATLLVILATMLAVRRSTLRPLNTLIDKIRLVQEDRKRLGEHVVAGGHREIRALAGAFNLMTDELRKLYDDLEQAAFCDSLTGLPNRAMFNDRSNQLVRQCLRSKGAFALFMMDLNRFKQINDSLGHQAGDELLHQVAGRLRECLRGSDTLARLDQGVLARLGGDEFAAVLPLQHGEDAAIAGRRILEGVAQPFQIEGHELHMGISIGIAIYPRDGDNLVDLMRRADLAMYQAKQAQRGFAFYSAMMDGNSMEQLTLEGALRQAMAEGGLELHFQPKIEIAGGRICGAEALLRWKHPERGWIPPDTFIPIAEQSGLIAPLTQWVLGQALRTHAEWQRQGHDVPVSVNISARSLHDESIVDLVRSLLRDSGVAAGKLTLEITENAIMAEPERAQAILDLLNDMGVFLSVDDFGTGHSSLAYLKRLPVDELKIDKSFVLDMLEDPNDAIIVRATIDLGHNLGLKVVAEGVETEAIHRCLKEYGCDVAQGYFHARPLAVLDFSNLLAAGKH